MFSPSPSSISADSPKKSLRPSSGFFTMSIAPYSSARTAAWVFPPDSAEQITNLLNRAQIPTFTFIDTNAGSAGSLILWKNLLIVNASSEAQSIMAFDKETGKQVWKQTASLLELAFGTPRIMKRENGREDLLFAAPSELWAMNPENGKLRWFAQHDLTGNVTPDAVVVGDLVCVFGGYPGIGRVAIKVGDKGEVAATDVVWRDVSSTYVPTPVAHDGKIYCISDQGLAWCVDAKSGNMLYRERAGSGGDAAPQGGGGRGRGMGKPFYASPIIVNGNVVAVSRKQGTFVYPAKAEFTAPVINLIADDNTDFNATPAVSDGCLFLRSNAALYCVGLK